MELSTALREAWDAVEAADLPEHVQSAAFSAAFTVVIGGSDLRFDTDSRYDFEDSDGSTENNSGALATVTGESFFARLSSNSGLSQAELQELFHLDASTPHLNVTGRQLGGSKKVRVEHIAVLLTGAHIWGLGESSVASDVIRLECQRYQALDRNFASYIRGLPSISYQGPTKEKRLALRPQREGDFAFVGKTVLGSE